jgi:hypothetical protein
MNAVNHSSAQEPLRRSIKGLLIAAGVASVLAAPVWAAAPADGVDAEEAMHAPWRTLMSQTPSPGEGCFHASYPEVTWQKLDCKIGQPRVRPTHVTPAEGAPDVTGNTNDYVAKAQGLITYAFGHFAISGVRSEEGVGVAAYGDGGILGENEYSVQINTNARETTSACDHHSGCTVWQQFVYAPDYYVQGEAAVYMQYWLLNWGSSNCPGGWAQYKADCYTNSAAATAPDVPATQLGKVGLSGSVVSGGYDSVAFAYGTDIVGITGKDNILDIASVWNKAEFNVVGNSGGSRADFNQGSSITVTLGLDDGSTLAPTCLADAGTTGESNNLNLGKCRTTEYTPQIQFTESN